MMHAITHGFKEWKQVPNAIELAKDFASEGHTSFAFMNLNKESNETGRTGTRWENLYAFVDKSRDYIRREIEILDPDIIVTANLFNKAREQMEKIFPKFLGIDLNDKPVPNKLNAWSKAITVAHHTCPPQVRSGKAREWRRWGGTTVRCA